MLHVFRLNNIDISLLEDFNSEIKKTFVSATVMSLICL